MLMPIEHLDDWDMRLKRQDAFWEGEVLDRPVMHMTTFRLNHAYPALAPHTGVSLRDRWMDTQYIAECALCWVMNTQFLGDALPSANPNLGPEVFSAFFGTKLYYGDSTSWSIPNLTDWADVAKVKFSTDNSYWKKIIEITDALLAIGHGKFYTGITDLHPGADAIVAFRDPAEMNIDMIEHPAEIARLLQYVTDCYFQVYDYYYGKLSNAGQAITCWPSIVSSKKWYVPSNDFSCMISKSMFDEMFLPGIQQECRHMEASIYHLDGPNALRHLDSLLEIPELNAIQWVFGDGHGRASDWLPVYQKCQAAGKGLQIGLAADEFDLFMDHLKPNGLWLSVSVESEEHAQALLKKALRWKG